MENFGWAFIGCGRIANKVAKELLKSDAGKIAAVWNRTRKKAENFSRKFGGRVYETAEEAIKASGVNCVYIATTHDRHAHYSALAVKFGVPVLCEKPAAVNFSQTEEIINKARERGVYFAEAMWTWHNPVSLKVREWIKSGAVGEIKAVTGVFAAPMVQFLRCPRLVSPELIGGALLDIGIYPVRYALELFGKPQSIACGGKVKGGVDYEEKIYMNYGTFTAEIFVSMNKFKPEKFVIEGTEGKITVNSFHFAKRAKLFGKYNERIKIKELLYGLQFEHTAGEVSEGLQQSRYCPHSATLDTMEILDECRRQMGVKYPCEE